MRRLLGLLPDIGRILELAKPQFVEGKWKRPEISRRRLALVRKEAVRRGLAWPLDEAEEAAREARRQQMIEKGVRMKGHKFERVQAKRKETIQEWLDKMPEMVAEHRKTQREARAKKRHDSTKYL